MTFLKSECLQRSKCTKIEFIVIPTVYMILNSIIVFSGFNKIIFHYINNSQYGQRFPAYVGTRATESNGGIYLIAGPQWQGTVLEGMAKIWAPTNLNWIIHRILVKGTSDVPNVYAIDDKIKLISLSIYQKNNKNIINSLNTLLHDSKIR